MKKDEIRKYVVTEYLKNNGKHLFINDIAKACKTNAKGVRSALDEDITGFEYCQADRWSGMNYCGRYVLSWAVEPSKTHLVRIINTQIFS